MMHHYTNQIITSGRVVESEASVLMRPSGRVAILSSRRAGVNNQTLHITNSWVGLLAPICEMNLLNW